MTQAARLLITALTDWVRSREKTTLEFFLIPYVQTAFYSESTNWYYNNHNSLIEVVFAIMAFIYLIIDLF